MVDVCVFVSYFFHLPTVLFFTGFLVNNIVNQLKKKKEKRNRAPVACVNFPEVLPEVPRSRDRVRDIYLVGVPENGYTSSLE